MDNGRSICSRVAVSLSDLLFNWNSAFACQFLGCADIFFAAYIGVGIDCKKVFRRTKRHFYRKYSRNQGVFYQLYCGRFNY